MSKYNIKFSPKYHMQKKLLISFPFNKIIADPALHFLNIIEALLPKFFKNIRLGDLYLFTSLIHTGLHKKSRPSHRLSFDQMIVLL